METAIHVSILPQPYIQCMNQEIINISNNNANMDKALATPTSERPCLQLSSKKKETIAVFQMCLSYSCHVLVCQISSKKKETVAVFQMCLSYSCYVLVRQLSSKKKETVALLCIGEMEMRNDGGEDVGKE